MTSPVNPNFAAERSTEAAGGAKKEKAAERFAREGIER